jgi:hypothetical protein
LEDLGVLAFANLQVGGFGGVSFRKFTSLGDFLGCFFLCNFPSWRFLGVIFANVKVGGVFRLFFPFATLQVGEILGCFFPLQFYKLEILGCFSYLYSIDLFVVSCGM